MDFVLCVRKRLSTPGNGPEPVSIHNIHQNKQLQSKTQSYLSPATLLATPDKIPTWISVRSVPKPRNILFCYRKIEASYGAGRGINSHPIRIKIQILLLYDGRLRMLYRSYRPEITSSPTSAIKLRVRGLRGMEFQSGATL